MSALKVVREQGANRMTLDAVAAEAEVSKGGLLYHFPTKRDLLKGMLKQYLRVMEQDLARLDRPGKNSTLRGFAELERNRNPDDELMLLSVLASAVEDHLLLDEGRLHLRRWLSMIEAEATDADGALLLFAALEGMRLMEMFGLIEDEEIPRRIKDRILIDCDKV